MANLPFTGDLITFEIKILTNVIILLAVVNRDDENLSLPHRHNVFISVVAAAAMLLSFHAKSINLGE